MPNYAEILKFEQEAPPSTIRLVQIGEFFRAINHSAWLFHCCIADHKVLSRYIKSVKQRIYYLGFPVKSLLSNIGDRESSKTEYGFDIQLKEDEIPDEEGYQTWFSTIELSDASNPEYNFLPLTGADCEREVIRRIREFPLESKTMVECTVFLAELRKMLSVK